jgi:hypothetical protein
MGAPLASRFTVTRATSDVPPSPSVKVKATVRTDSAGMDSSFWNVMALTKAEMAALVALALNVTNKSFAPDPPVKVPIVMVPNFTSEPEVDWHSPKSVDK